MEIPPKVLNELIRAIFIAASEGMDPETYDKISSLDLADPQLVEHLKTHNDGRHAKIRGRKSASDTPQATRRNADGTPDFMNGIDKKARDFMQNNRQRIASETQRR